ncbi:hypothetical protein VKT23_000951 [Stygiomarasmius scandens]|uniref:Uncharacterized protein n=1 Tax=Marasmiellus scandens TaxID=2682957 RepID=A0ABR1K5Z7_9AGAR
MLDDKAIGCIALRLPYDVRVNVQTFTPQEVSAEAGGKSTYTSKMMWDKIKTEYGTERTITQFNESQSFNNFAINVQVDPKKQFAVFNNLCNRIQVYSGKVISDHKRAFQIISKLPKHDSWEFIRMQLLHKHSSQKDLKMTEVESTILDHYYSLHPHESSNKAFTAHVAKISGQSGNQYKGKPPRFNSQQRQSAPQGSHQQQQQGRPTNRGSGCGGANNRGNGQGGAAKRPGGPQKGQRGQGQKKAKCQQAMEAAENISGVNDAFQGMAFMAGQEDRTDTRNIVQERSIVDDRSGNSSQHIVQTYKNPIIPLQHVSRSEEEDMEMSDEENITDPIVGKWIIGKRHYYDSKNPNKTGGVEPMSNGDYFGRRQTEYIYGTYKQFWQAEEDHFNREIQEGMIPSNHVYIYGDPYLHLVPKEDQEWLNDEYVDYLDKLWNFNKAFVKNSIRQMMQEGQSIPAVVLQRHIAFIAQEETVSDGDTLMDDMEYVSRVNTPLDYTDDEEAEDLDSDKENIPPLEPHSPSPDSIPKWTPETGNHNWETNEPGSGWEEADWGSDSEELPLLPLPHKERGYGAGENKEFFLRTLGSQPDDDDTRHWCITGEIKKNPKETQVYVTKWIDSVRYRTTTLFKPYLWKPLHYSEVWQMQKGKVCFRCGHWSTWDIMVQSLEDTLTATEILQRCINITWGQFKYFWCLLYHNSPVDLRERSSHSRYEDYLNQLWTSDFKETWEEYKSTWSKEWQEKFGKEQKEFLDSEQGMELLSRIRKEFDGNFADKPTYKPKWVLEIPEQKIPAKQEVIQQEQLVNPEDQKNPPSMRFSHNNWGPMTVQDAQAFYDDLYHNNFKLWIKSNWTAFFSDIRKMVFKEENLAKYIPLTKVADLYNTNCWESSTSRDIIFWRLQNDEKYHKTVARSAVQHLPMAPLNTVVEVDENDNHTLRPPCHLEIPTPPPSPTTGSEKKPAFITGEVVQLLNLVKQIHVAEKLHIYQDSLASQTGSHSPTLADYGNKVLCRELKQAQKSRMEWEAKQWGVMALLSLGKSEARRESSGAPEPGQKSRKH